MELQYIYILNYRNTFVKQEFNFSTQWRFHYEESQQALNVAENPLYLERFFELPDRLEEEGKVVNVTGVIGKNGAGKTTVLDFIKENLVEGAGVVESPAIIVVKQGKDKRVYTHTSLSVLHGNFRDYGYKVTPYDNQQNPLRTPLPNTSVVFFSNIFDAKRESEWTGMRNISTNFLVVDAKLRALEMKRVDPTFSETVYYRREEILKQLLLIRRNEENEFHLPIEMPDRVMVIPNSVATRVEELPSGNKKLTPEMEKFHYLQTQVFHWLVEMKLNAKGLDSIKLTYFIAAVNTFLYEMATFYSYVLSDGFLNLRNTYAKNIDPQQSAYEKVRAFIQKVQDSFTKEKEPDHVMDRVQSLQRFLQVLDAGITEDSVVDGSHFALLTSPPEGRVDILSFLDAYTRAIHFLPFLEFEWRDLSSGQKALLATYARFYSISDEVERAANMRLEDQVLILIDEGELYLHPEWQRGFLAGLLSFLPKIYKNRNLQIVLTSNSPFIASDLPNSNLIFIEKTEAGCRVIDGLAEEKMTFAANIHTLLSDAFFMNKGLIGDFASHKVNMVIRKIKNNGAEALLKEKHAIEALISQIGEPVLRSKLYSMYKEKVDLYIEKDSVNEQLLRLVQDLRSELDELKKERGR